MKVCDICKKEITVQSANNVEISNWLFITKKGEYCKNCTNKIIGYIQKLENNGGKNE